MSQNTHSAVSYPTNKISSSIFVPGDKSISHRAIMLASLAQGTSYVSGLLESEDVMATINAFKAMGVIIEKQPDNRYCIEGVGLNGLKAPQNILDMGNAGTAMRLIAGILSAQKFNATLVGDDSLNKRPMGRIIEPLSQQGAKIEATGNGLPPLTIYGGQAIKGGYFSPKVASAQVKSAILLAGLWGENPTIVHEPIPTRDYTEKMLKDLGANIEIIQDDNGGKTVKLIPGNPLVAQDIIVPGDISSAAFPLVAAAIVPGSDLTIQNVGMHPTRDGIIRSLQKMGANITLNYKNNNQIADIHIVYTPLKATEIPGVWAASQIDEYPALAVAAANAAGETLMTNIGELRVKESDRLDGIAQGLKACGVTLEEGEDWLRITGTSKRIEGGAEIKTHLDHRMAMSFIIAAMNANNPIEIDDMRPIETSFPNFVQLMEQIGGNIVGKSEK
ncbi:MAG: 3-phosphoshikimate 1-carboxyvinyltransferase [Alphaproteobacteria bacterium]